MLGCSMAPEEYVRKAKRFLTPEHHNPIYLSEGLIGEIGEVYVVLKQRYGGKVNRTELILKLGDVFWYATMLGDLYGNIVHFLKEELDFDRSKFVKLLYDKAHTWQVKWVLSNIVDDNYYASAVAGLVFVNQVGYVYDISLHEIMVSNIFNLELEIGS